MLYSKTMAQFYWNCKRDIKRLLGKYSRNFVKSSYEATELEQRFYMMMVRRDVLDRFDTSVTNIDKVFTSYICEHVKYFCKEEMSRIIRERELRKLHTTDMVGPNSGEIVSIYDAALFSWLPGTRDCRYSTEFGNDSVVDNSSDGGCYEDRVVSLCDAVKKDRGLSEQDKKAILALVYKGSCGATAGEIASQMGVRNSHISNLRKQARERYSVYRRIGRV
jgi:hypothetical protein